MKRLIFGVLASMLTACGPEWECDVYLNGNNHQSYSNLSYPGDTEEEAEDNCESDYSSARCSCDEVGDDD
jgi:hypothetical protein